MTLRMTSAIFLWLYISVQSMCICISDIIIELILKHIIRIGCGFYTYDMNRYAFRLGLYMNRGCLKGSARTPHQKMFEVAPEKIPHYT